eukprot:CAMPEP_0201506794 /NCGR_PEP_ID=MMETSP0161_2-20130828/643_1 /ASSEMBLY_ACC=CAM_ASM_000251 /TAXON_ID=180227 /ORGANISM="Neoparamoeba aestuarina, Strain SoJaBio B1-5/56/2" /LENGTH=145 /DNA_ID=CAMNT_0047900989 /DNA_START=140 /DNA_END=577 /DNA_ORIENTATION=-
MNKPSVPKSVQPKPQTGNLPAQAAKPQTPAPAPGAAPPAQGGGSMMGNFASSMAGSMAGSVIGHTIADKMLGGSEAAPQEGYEQQGYEQQQEMGSYEQQDYTQNPCMKEMAEFNKCLERSNGDISVCQWSFDMMQQCKVEASQWH